MKPRLFAIIIGVALLAQVSAAHAVVANWSWTAVKLNNVSYPVGTVGPVVSGTISGLLDNTANQTNVTITVDQPGGLATGWVFLSGAAGTGFNVVNGLVTYGFGAFTNGNGFLYFGAPDVGQWFPGYSRTSDPVFNLTGAVGSITYTAVSAVPVPAPLGLLATGLIGLVAIRRNRP
jgi:hypothetical protein